MKNPPSPAGDFRLFFFMGIGCLVLLVLLLNERAGLEEALNRGRALERRLEAAERIVESNKDVFAPFASRAAAGLPKGKSLRTLVMDASEEVGISRNLEAIFPSVDTRKKVVRARVSFRGITLRNMVKFFVRLRNLSPLVRDREASLRMLGYNQDRWRLDVTLEAPLPAAEAGRGVPGK